jgi:hypothetical protein
MRPSFNKSSGAKLTARRFDGKASPIATNRRPHTLARFGHNLINKPNNRYGRQAIDNINLNRDGNRFNAPKYDRMNLCVHGF